MGNSSQSTPKYFQTSHPALKQTHYNKSTHTLELFVPPGLQYSNWRWNLSPLEIYRKHLFQPVKFADPQNQKKQQNAWCKQENGQIDSLKNSILVCYEPFVYTLESQIFVRKSINTHFKEHQLWKVLKYGTLAIKDWNNAYPDTVLTFIEPRNVLLNYQGQIRMAHNFSFMQEIPKNNHFGYYPSNSDKQTPLSLVIYSLGVTLLDTCSLAQCRYSSIPIPQKRTLLHSSNLYPLQIKQLILAMTETNPLSRPTLNDILQALQIYKRQTK